MVNDGSKSGSMFRQILILHKMPNLFLFNFRKDIKASVVDYIIAGVDTIGNSIIFTIALIAQHPQVQKRLQHEVDSFLSSG